MVNRPPPSLASVHDVTTMSPSGVTPPQNPLAAWVSTPAAFNASMNFPKAEV
jgi:hypothetical protein